MSASARVLIEQGVIAAFELPVLWVAPIVARSHVAGVLAADGYLSQNARAYVASALGWSFGWSVIAAAVLLRCLGVSPIACAITATLGELLAGGLGAASLLLGRPRFWVLPGCRDIATLTRNGKLLPRRAWGVFAVMVAGAAYGLGQSVEGLSPFTPAWILACWFLSPLAFPD